MDEYYNKADAMNVCKKGEFSLAKEKDLTSSKHTFLVGLHADFFTEIENSAEKRYHECIFGNLPIKPFLDLESCDLSLEKFYQEVDSILEKLTVFGQPFFLTSSREEKHSFHVIYPYTVCKTVYHVKTVVERIKSPIIDMAVYKPGTLRLAFCTSFRSFPHVLKPFDWKTKSVLNKGEYNREYLKLSMLHYFENHGQPFSLPNQAQLFRRNMFTSSSHGGVEGYDTKLYAWAGNKQYTIVNYKESDDEIRLLLRGVVCPRINRAHKSNNFYLIINLSEPAFPSFFGCLDAECCKEVKFNGPNFSTILKAEKMLMEITTS